MIDSCGTVQYEELNWRTGTLQQNQQIKRKTNIL